MQLLLSFFHTAILLVLLLKVTSPVLSLPAKKTPRRTHLIEPAPLKGDFEPGNFVRFKHKTTTGIPRLGVVTDNNEKIGFFALWNNGKGYKDGHEITEIPVLYKELKEFNTLGTQHVKFISFRKYLWNPDDSDYTVRKIKVDTRLSEDSLKAIREYEKIYSYMGTVDLTLGETTAAVGKGSDVSMSVPTGSNFAGVEDVVDRRLDGTTVAVGEDSDVSMSVPTGSTGTLGYKIGDIFEHRSPQTYTMTPCVVTDINIGNGQTYLGVLYIYTRDIPEYRERAEVVSHSLHEALGLALKRTEPSSELYITKERYLLNPADSFSNKKFSSVKGNALKDLLNHANTLPLVDETGNPLGTLLPPGTHSPLTGFDEFEHSLPYLETYLESRKRKQV